MGIIFQELGRFDEAAKCFSRSIPLSRRAGDARHVAWSEFHLATVHYLRGDLRKARRAMSLALEHAKMLNDLSHVSNCGHGLALIEFQEGQLVSALRRSRACLSQAKTAGQGEWSGMDWEHLGVCFWEARRHHRAQRCFKTGEHLLKLVADNDALSELCSYRAELLCDEGRLPAALREASVAVALARKGGLPEFLSRAQFTLGSMEYLTGNTVSGRRNLRQGLRLAGKVPVISLELTFTGARLGLADPKVCVFDRSILEWAMRIYKVAGNDRRSAVLKGALGEWKSVAPNDR